MSETPMNELLREVVRSRQLARQSIDAAVATMNDENYGDAAELLGAARRHLLRAASKHYQLSLRQVRL